MDQVIIKNRFTVDITAPCGRANYDGGETILETKKERFMIGDFIASFPGYRKLRNGDAVEVVITVLPNE